MRVIWLILKLLLKIVVAPVILALTLFVWICVGIVYISGLVLVLISMVIALLGVAVLAGLLGAVSYWLMQGIRRARNPMYYLLYAQVAVYLMLSFFTTWFSNPTTWFYLAVTALMAVAVSRRWGS